jgi:phage I-like protein
MSDLALCAAISIEGGDQPPEWLHLLPAGEVRTQDGRGPYRVSDPRALITASMAAGKLVLDENHATDLAAPKGLPAPARGWIVQLQHRSDGIWGRVEWTEQARRTRTWRSYRGVSPVIAHRKDGTVLTIARASLTNTPNLTGLTALHAQGNDMELRSALIRMLGLPASSDDAVIIAKVEALVKQRAGKDVAMMSGVGAHVETQELALQATRYQARMARDGIAIGLPEAVRAVHAGTAL